MRFVLLMLFCRVVAHFNVPSAAPAAPPLLHQTSCTTRTWFYPCCRFQLFSISLCARRSFFFWSCHLACCCSCYCWTFCRCSNCHLSAVVVHTLLTMPKRSAECCVIHKKCRHQKPLLFVFQHHQSSLVDFHFPFSIYSNVTLGGTKSHSWPISVALFMRS